MVEAEIVDVVLALDIGEVIHHMDLHHQAVVHHTGGMVQQVE